ncbi:hypothetical protein [Flavobacterium capsici]|uniref:Uncharacterized protein n=1 Tax=Flavobacterium capsici TaxID=3075618 RepID=A0AA96F1I5_9FLAO|nr:MULTISPECIES: hypothetical protein [unclassified Flavobacterium]WNM19471.1 hypothetical protein RN608_02030 [Flavobacterium sp. PMR2A8]WNM20860.1 hypothetical protein RN605_09200 [Flavobacterium sp. PMTSA4]
MKKVIFLTIFLSYFFGYTQTSIIFGTASGTTNGYVNSGEQFAMNISVSPQSGCTNINFNLNIGSCTYIQPSSQYQYPSFVTVTPNVVSNQTTLSISINNSANNNNISFTITLRSPIVCQSSSPEIMQITAAPGNNNTCTLNLQQSFTLNISNLQPTIGIFTINEVSGVGGAICRGNVKINALKVILTNPIAGWTINNPTMKINLPLCTSVEENPNVYEFTELNGDMVVSWINLPNTINPGASIEKIVYFRINCDSCSVFPLSFQPIASYTGTKCSQSTIASTSTPFNGPIFQGNNNEICFGSNNCNANSYPSIPNTSVSFSPPNPFHCPNATPPIEDCTYLVNIGSTLTLTNLDLVTNIPDQVIINTIKLTVNQSAASCTGAVNYYYSYLTDQNSTTWSNEFIIIPGASPVSVTPPSGQKITKIRWNFPDTCQYGEGVPITLDYTYNYLPNIVIPPINPITNLPLENGGFDCSVNYTASELITQYPTGKPVPIKRNLNNQIAGLFDCLPVVLTNQVKLKNSTDNFVSNISVQPNSELTYLLSISPNNLSNLILNQNLTTKLIDVANFRYYFGTATPSTSNFENLFTTCSGNNCNLNLYSGSNAVLNYNSINNSLTITGLDFSNTNNILYIMYDAKLNDNLISGSSTQGNATTFFTISQQNQFVYSNDAIVQVIYYRNLQSRMYAKCVKPEAELWSDDIVYVRNNEKIDFKMELKNTGSVPIKVFEIQNLKPMSGDSMINNPNSPRGSDFSVNYFCDFQPTVSITPSQSQPVFNKFYSSVGSNKEREFLYPPVLNGNLSLWVQNNCLLTSNWIKFSNENGVLLNPGQSLNVVYRGKISGATGTSGSAVNSFGAKLKYDGDSNFINPGEDFVTLVNNGEGCNPPCIDCASFALLKKEKYLVSGWVSEQSKKDPNRQFKNYDSSAIRLSFKDKNGAPLEMFDENYQLIGLFVDFHASGEIIDGWQRIVGEFTVPNSPTGEVGDMTLELLNESGENISYFDDIRILPSKGNMKSFVYDQKTQRLMAELDENNYSTFYEYDLEGGLIRIKKETEKGVFTIQETRSGNTKQLKH